MLPRSVTPMPVLLFLVGGVLLGGGWAFIYAHDHDPTPEADPMAVHLLSHAAYHWLHYGGIGLVALRVSLVVGAAVAAFVTPPRTRFPRRTRSFAGFS